jgi:hypothetical protein
LLSEKNTAYLDKRIKEFESDLDNISKALKPRNKHLIFGQKKGEMK